MKAAFYTLGCKVNQYETQIMEQRLKAAGFDIVPPEQFADVYIVNSCTVTAESDRKTRQILRRLNAGNPQALTVLSGCFPQSSPERAKSIPEADIIAGTRERADILDLIREALASGERLFRVNPFGQGGEEEPMRAEGLDGHTRAFVKIEDGCESYCAYCIIPYARGPVRSKPADAIRDEVEGLATRGYKEAVLVGINLSSYGRDCGRTLEDAVTAACSTSIERIRFGSLEPNVITPGFIDCVRSLDKVCPHFHLALQSGCEQTLRRMNRRYTPQRFREAAAALRQAFPGCGITTDIIVGFPGETQEEFAQSLAFAHEIGFSQAHVFPYSKRAGTKAAAMPDQISKAEKSERCRIMIDTCRASQHAFWQAHIGKSMPVLFETGHDGVFEGFAPDYIPVKLRSGIDLAGQIAQTLITDYDSEGCIGVVLN